MISLPKRASEWCYAASKYCGIQLIQIVALVAFSSLSNAAELGELRVYSTLGEPLKAEIELANMDDISEQELEVRLASEEASRQSGALRDSYLYDIRFSVVSARDGSKLIRIASDQPLEDPALELNLELSWPFGKITKKYSTLLKSSEQEPPSSSYGPVKEKDTLWSIAQKLRPNRSISVQQMMLAIQRKNANSFLGCVRASLDLDSSSPGPEGTGTGRGRAVATGASGRGTGSAARRQGGTPLVR